MFGRPLGLKLLNNVYKYFSSFARQDNLYRITGRKMFKKINKANLASLAKMGATSSAFKVDEKTPIFYSRAKILAKNDRGHETFRLYHIEESGIFEAVLYNPDERTVCLSIFRLEDESKAREMFGHLCDRLSPFYQSSSRVFKTQMLQSLLNCLEKNPAMELAVVARQVGLTECLKHEKIAASAVDITDNKSSDANLLQAAKFGFKGKCETFLTNAGLTSITKGDEKGNTAVHYAVGQPDFLDKLLIKSTELGSEVVNKVNNSEETPLHIACTVNHAKAVEVLLNHGADLNTPSDYAYPIHSAVKYVSTDCVKVICQRKRDSVHQKDKKYEGTPLHWSKKKEITNFLIATGADVEAGNSKGETPLHIMIKRKRLDCLVSLLSHGADANALGMSGKTPLHMAVEVGDVDIVKALIVFGADLNAVNDKNETARHVATVSNNRFRNPIIHALCLVGAAPCNPRKCNHPCNTPFTVEKYSVDEKCNKLSSTKKGSVVTNDDLARIMAAGAHSNVKYSTLKPGKNENDGKSIMKKKRSEDSALCLDGGGIRGLILLQVLLNLERIAKQPLVKLFDWVAGTSTGGILALGLLHGKSVAYLQQLYFRFKDEVFVGTRPYPSEPFEEFLKQEFGENTKMTKITYPRTLATGTVSDRIPPALHLFRNFSIPEDDNPPSGQSLLTPMVKPQDQLVWRAARGTGAAPTYFRAMGRMLDGGLIANNPTLDLLSFIHCFYKNAQPNLPAHATCKKLGLVFSIGTGKPPEVPVTNIDVLRPSTISDVAKVAFGVQALLEVMVEQATSSTGAVVDRAKSWCEMVDVFYRRLNPQMFTDVQLDERNDQVLVNMLWEAQVYLFERRHVLKEVVERLT